MRGPPHPDFVVAILNEHPPSDLMSEYQYYEFQAIDKPLTEEEMQVLRSFSTRARITPTRFVNYYEWGSFRGDEDAWMDRFFDAFLYSSNFGSRTFMLRLPSNLIDIKTVRRYCHGVGASVRARRGKIILTFSIEFEDFDESDTGEGWLSSLVPLRADLARGDLRALYLGWLHLVQERSIKPGAVEPPVPAGLGRLSASLRSLVEFLRLDPALLEAAAESSAPIGSSLLSAKEIRDRIARVPPAAKDRLLASLLGSDGGAHVSPALQEFFGKYKLDGDLAPARATRRSAGQLLARATNPTRNVRKPRRS